MTRRERARLTQRLDAASGGGLLLYAIACSFATYFCMYAFRKPFAAAEYAGLRIGPLDLKTALMLSQVIGYALSKYLGIKFVSEVSRQRRAPALVGLILAAQGALFVVGLAREYPAWQVVAMFFNGLPLGMVWGLVVWYLEGRRGSELMLAGLSCSFIVASSVVKDVGRSLIAHWGVSEAWMPFSVGLLFLGPLLLFSWLLNQMPEPNAADVAARSRRERMVGVDRAAFVRQFFPGFVLLLAAYLLLTAYRDFRDNYGIEIFRQLGYADTPAVFSRTDLPVGGVVLGAMAMLNLVRDNRRGLIGVFVVCLLGMILLAGGTLLLDRGCVSGLTWMILTGAGSYLAYVPFGSVLFDRLIAATRANGTAVFGIYVADAVGYTGSVGMQLYKDLGHAAVSRLRFFRWLTYVLAAVGGGCLLAACGYFASRARRQPLADKP